MLVISRTLNQSFFIGNSQVKILGIQGGRVRLGIEAPADVPIHRDVERVTDDHKPQSRKGRDDVAEPNDL